MALPFHTSAAGYCTCRIKRDGFTGTTWPGAGEAAGPAAGAGGPTAVAADFLPALTRGAEGSMEVGPRTFGKQLQRRANELAPKIEIVDVKCDWFHATSSAIGSMQP